MTVDFDPDEEVARIAKVCRKPMREWTVDELHSVFAYTIHQIQVLASDEEEGRARAMLRSLGMPRDQIESQIEDAQAGSLLQLTSVVHDVSGELERRDPGYLLTEDRWRDRYAEVLSNQVQRYRT